MNAHSHAVRHRRHHAAITENSFHARNFYFNHGGTAMKQLFAPGTIEHHKAVRRAALRKWAVITFLALCLGATVAGFRP